ncbi:precorrin-2 C(20)-methyltransferase [Prochlorococcus sp. MIT 1223]|uniref:precorrin-2 C(20)-methyltransferase n=1 Tax=Prochlorococcus sp. MIT 1223 TaxID=3096217 RepID=UPI002A749957|nr:precorrin-2 C(20)-methyltransferase [Prochlorococcus sp. MIT 1223]
MSSYTKGQLTIVGLGPGDPSLLTLAAVKAIKEASVVAFPVSATGGESLALKIASDWITTGQKKIPLTFPMVADVELRKIAWSLSSDQLAKEVSKGEQVVFLCQGDSSLFATSSYLLLALKFNYPNCPVNIIPGINSFSAAAAVSQLPLGFQQEQLLIVPIPSKKETLETLLREVVEKRRILVLLKLGQKWIWVRPLLDEMNLLEDSVFAQRIGFDDQKVMKARDVPQSECPYFSLLIIRQTWPDVLPEAYL